MNRVNVRVIILLLAAIAVASSCELLFTVDVPDTSPQSIFDQVWTFADREYSFFELKGVDWDAVYETYSPLVSADMTDEELFDLTADMLFELQDGHVNLRSTFDFSRNWQWFLDYEQNFDWTLLERDYFNDEQQYIGPFVTFDFGDIVYARYGSFSSAFEDAHLDYLFDHFSERDAFILDIRDNGGGSSSNAYRIANRLVGEPTVVGAERYKNGPAHDAFTDLRSIGIAPPDGHATWLKPVAVLTNRSSYSATNLLVALVTGLENVVTVGDATGGGGGIPTFTELSNGWSLRVSGHQFFAYVSFQTELYNVELGIPPDIDVDQTQVDTDAGRDTILETALAYLRGL